MRFHQKAPRRAFLTRREADVLLGTMERGKSGDADKDAAHGEAGDVRAAWSRAIAARDHAAFSTMVYAGLRIEEATALAVYDLSFARGAEEVRVAKGKGRLVPMEPRLRRSLRRYLRQRDVLIPAEVEAPFPASS